MAEDTVFTLSHVAQHKSKNDCWLVIDGRHVGIERDKIPGRTSRRRRGTARVSREGCEFKEIGHSKAARNLLFNHQVGVHQDYALNNDADVQVASTSTDEPQRKEMSAFVIKDDHVPKYAALVEFFVPLLVAASYFSYRYLTTGSSSMV